MIKVAIPITGQQEYKALKKIIFSGKFVSGKTVEIFEKDFAKFIGTKYAICMNSGTAALHAALSSINLKPNDEAVDFHIPIIAKFWRKHIIINIPKRKLLFLKSNKIPIIKPDKTIGLNQRIPNS